MLQIMKLGLLFLTLLPALAHGAKQHVTCERNFRKLGCFKKDDSKAELMITDRQVGHSLDQGYLLDWYNFDKSLHSLSCRCYEKAKEKGFKYFSIRYWGECWGGKDEDLMTNTVLDPKKKSSGCINVKYKKCDVDAETECAGTLHTEYIYTFTSDAKTNVDGGYGEWSEYSPCSLTCGVGVKARERACNNPVPEGNGADCVGPSTQTKECKVVDCPVNGGFTAWTDWSDCSKTCGSGVSSRQRHCTNPEPQHGGLACDGKSVDIKSCTVTKCPVKGGWSEWSALSQCSTSCGSGVKTRQRTCSNPAPAHGGADCPIDDAVESTPCKDKECPVNGGWSQWSAFGLCSRTCGVSETTQTRTCTEPKPSHGGVDCLGESTNTQTCNLKECPVNGNWGEWESFGACDQACGAGTKSRARKCDSPAPQHEGDDCIGDGTQDAACKVKECPVNGGYSDWSDYSACSKSCGLGKRSRIRACNSPTPAHGGNNCLSLGPAREETDCLLVECPIDGGMSEWSVFSVCSKSCGEGTKIRSRECNNPEPQFNGKNCVGDTVDTIKCNLSECPINGRFSQWSVFTVCSKSCGTGEQTRTRTCSDPAPLNGGKDCVGGFEEKQECKLKECPVNGGWSAFSDYSTCSHTCGTGTQSKTRTCTDPEPAHGGEPCIGTDEMTRECKLIDCPVDGGLTPWSMWSDCSRTCGTGEQSRSRSCTDPAPQYGGKSCDRQTYQSQTCKLVKCPVDGGWSDWGEPTECSVTCGSGEQMRTRTCTNPSPSHGGKDCVGDDHFKMGCFPIQCPVNGGYSTWSTYGACSMSCGDGMKTRHRTCNSPTPAYGGKDCEGHDNEATICNEVDCPIDGGFSEWSDFGACSEECGAGVKYRNRTCTNPRPQHGGERCDGEYKQQAICKDKECPVDGEVSQWSDFSACTHSCGEGTKTRTRSCSNPEPAHGGEDCRETLEETLPCKLKECPVNGGLSAWSSFTNCSLVCGSGKKHRVRECDNPKPMHGGAACTGELKDSVKCNTHPCPVDGGFSTWSSYTACSAECGEGEQTRTRSCSAPAPQHGGMPCDGVSIQSKTCKIKECPINGGFSEWTPFSACSHSCGSGTKTRHRACTNPTPQYDGAQCVGSTTETERCMLKECPVNGAYTEWSEYTSCSKSCGNGIQTRERECTNPSPAYGGNECSGENTQTGQCKVRECPVDGGFTEWSKFTRCSAECGKGTKSRTRSCTNPKPAHGGVDCGGKRKERWTCKLKDCPVDGGFSQWSAFGACSMTCGEGEKTRQRTCTAPKPAHGGDLCRGPRIDRKMCKVKECPVDGGLSSWSAYSECSKKCGGGRKHRTRTCTNPAPLHGGKKCIGITRQDVDCNKHECPINGGLTAWSQFTECSEHCGPGTHERTRSCMQPKPQYGGQDCSGKLVEVKECKIKECPVDSGYGEWSGYTHCSASCGVGKMSRTRVCEHAKYDCSGLAKETVSCEIKPCPVNGRFNDWSDFTECSATCGAGEKSRTRTCSNPAPQHGGAGCFGARKETLKCKLRECPVNGGYGEWTAYMECSEKCGGGKQERSRACDSPKPLHGGNVCRGPNTDERSCNVEPCPINGGLSPWSAFSPCTASCGEGDRTRTRACTNPAPQHGGKKCVGALSETESCEIKPCPVNGGFSEWSAYGKCSKECGSGSQTRERSCSNPSPVHGGKDCRGPKSESRTCKVKECPVNGGYGQWMAYGKCSSLCNGGKQYRTRACDSPAPKYGGSKCRGPATDERSCNSDPCPVNGGFSEWSAYGKCSKECGSGSQTRERSCSNPSPAHGGKDCRGPKSESRTCKVKECPVNGGFGPWSDFTDCSTTCGMGGETRSRKCNNPAPAHGGKDCEGGAKQFQVCKLRECPVDGGITEWSDWSECSQHCGPGTQHRVRSCTNPSPLYGGESCDEELTETRKCTDKPCPVDGNLSQWSKYSACSRSCGSGAQQRTRTCTAPAPLHGGKACRGPTKDNRSCNLRDCPIDGKWSPWQRYSTCSEPCGEGKKTRVRHCTRPKPQHGGKTCPGVAKQTVPCKVKECPVDGGFSEWSKFSACSESCGYGGQTRTRACNNPKPLHGGENCVGKTRESRRCKVKECPVHGNWGAFGPFGHCSARCNGGMQERTRKCDSPAPKYGGRSCAGSAVDKKSCNTDPCPVNGGFNEWSKFSACSESCGYGGQTRTRVCNNPKPLHGGENCVGKTRESRRCKVKECPVNGGFSDWSAYGKCSKECGSGSQTRERSCSNPSRAHGGKDCRGPKSESRTCKVKECPVNGGWSGFGNYGGCSKDCGGGAQTAHRTCTNPTPQYGGKKCSGGSTMVRRCNAHYCPINGGLSQWSGYSQCSRTCGKGVQHRTRACNSPTPAHGGALCSGVAMQQRECKVKECPVNGGWSGWGSYSRCSKECGVGQQYTKRTCSNPSPAHGGKKCAGASVYYRNCKLKDCPVNGVWGAWGAFGGCTKSCQGGMRRRVRECNNPAPAHGGKTCPGGSAHDQVCNWHVPCKVNGGFSEWSKFSACSESCGYGGQTRTRVCNNPKPLHGGENCVGKTRESRRCKVKECPVNGGWSGWRSYSTCSKKCGGGTRQRNRYCNNPTPKNGGAACRGPSVDRNSCNTHACSGWSSWSSLGPCSRTCGGGMRTRTRACAPGSTSCSGRSAEHFVCATNVCPKVINFDKIKHLWGKKK